MKRLHHILLRFCKLRRQMRIWSGMLFDTENIAQAELASLQGNHVAKRQHKSTASKWSIKTIRQPQFVIQKLHVRLQMLRTPGGRCCPKPAARRRRRNEHNSMARRNYRFQGRYETADLLAEIAKYRRRRRCGGCWGSVGAAAEASLY